MADMRMYYAFNLEDDVLGRKFRGQNLSFVYLDEQVTGKERDAATAYIQEQDPRIAFATCRGQLGFNKAIAEKHATAVPSLPPQHWSPLSRLKGLRERAALRKVNALEEQWPTGNESNVAALLGYLKHPGAEVRGAAAIAIGEYLALIDRKYVRGPVFGKAVAALLDALSSETRGSVLVHIGSALGNTHALTTPKALVAALRGRSSTDVAKVAKGLRLLRENEYRTQLLEALEALHGRGFGEERLTAPSTSERSISP